MNPDCGSGPTRRFQSADLTALESMIRILEASLLSPAVWLETQSIPNPFPARPHLLATALRNAEAPVSVVSGVSGTGKSVLLREMQKVFAVDDTKLCGVYLAAQDGSFAGSPLEYVADALLGHCLHQHAGALKGTSPQTTRDRAFESLRTLIAANPERHVYLLLDEVTFGVGDDLNVRRLLGLVEEFPGRVHVVFFRTERYQSVLAQANLLPQVPQLKIPPLSADEVSSFARNCLSSCGGTIDDDALPILYSMSGGQSLLSTYCILQALRAWQVSAARFGLPLCDMHMESAAANINLMIQRNEPHRLNSIDAAALARDPLEIIRTIHSSGRAYFVSDGELTLLGKLALGNSYLGDSEEHVPRLRDLGILVPAYYGSPWKMSSEIYATSIRHWCVPTLEKEGLLPPQMF